MIELLNISKAYPTNSGSKTILDDVSFTFKYGENVGILAKNGTGKSTLMRILGKAEYPDSGKVIHRAKISWPMAFGGGFNGSLTGAENCRFVSRIYNKDIDQVTKFTKDFSELGTDFMMPLKTYSSGMRSRLAFSLSMAVEFDCYLIDEVLGVGDKAFQKKCQHAIEERKSKSSIILVSHNQRKIRSHCDSVLVLYNAKLNYFEDVQEGINFYNEVYGLTQKQITPGERRRRRLRQQRRQQNQQQIDQDA